MFPYTYLARAEGRSGWKGILLPVCLPVEKGKGSEGMRENMGAVWRGEEGREAKGREGE